MTTDDLVADLLFRWESAKIKPSVESLCNEHVDLIPRIREIAIIQKFNQHFEEDPPDIPPGPPPTPVIPGHSVGAYIGAGGMGHVWEATDLALNRTVALKILKLIGSGEEIAIATQRFRREMRLAARLRHPGIATIFAGDLLPVTPGEQADPARSYYYTMELIHGGKRIRGDMLDEYVRNLAPSPRVVLELFLKVCEAVAYAHSEGIIHRDLKPANIMVNAEGQPKILDLGIARDIREKASSFTAKYGGTPDYMGLAQRHGEEASPEMDVHALGCILFDLLCIASPHPGGGREHVTGFQRVITPDMVRTSIIPAPSAPVSLICRTQKNTTADSPFPDASMLVKAIRAYLEETREVQQERSSPFLPRGLIATLGIAVLLLIGSVVWWRMRTVGTPSPPAPLPAIAATSPAPLSESQPLLYMQVRSKSESTQESIYLSPPQPVALSTRAEVITPSNRLPVKIQARLNSEGKAIITAPGVRWLTLDSAAPDAPIPPDDNFKPGEAAVSLTGNFLHLLVRFEDNDGKVGYVILEIRYGI